MSYLDKIKVADETYDIKDPNAATAEALAAEATAREGADGALQTAIDAKQAALTEPQLTAVNSGIDATKVGQIATNASDIDTIEGKIPAQATSSNQLADKDFVNSSVATNTANYISNNGEPFASLADLQAYSGTLTNNDYAFVVGTDAAGNTTYTRYKYNASTATWAEEYVLNNSSFTADQWAAIQSGITAGLVTKLNNIEAGAEVNDIDSISVNGTAVTPDVNKNVDLTIPTVNDATLTITQNGTSVGTFTANASTDATVALTDTTYSDFTGTDGTSAGTAGLVPAPATTDAGKYLGADGSWSIIPNEIIQNAGAPTTSTAGTLGQLLTDTTNAKLYQLTAIDTTDPDNPSYTWTEVGGSSVNVVQTTGTSTTDVMSQNAVTSMVYADPGTNARIKIGNQYSKATKEGAIAIGFGTTNSMYGTKATGLHAIAIGTRAAAAYNGSVALGFGAVPSGDGVVSIGNDVGGPGYGYNSSNYRLLTGVYDGQSAHDAATFGQLNTRLGGMTILQITQTDYDALATKDPNTLYVITGA